MSEHILEWFDALLKRWRIGLCMMVAFRRIRWMKAIEVQARCWDSSKA